MIYEKGLCSVVCLGYNHARFLKQNIESIWSQEYENIEIVVVDDGSVDNSIKLLQELEKVSPVPMHIINQYNTGNLGKNLNNGLKVAKGEFVLFISLDDMLIKGTIANKIKYMLRDEKIAFVANTMVTVIDSNGNTPKNAELKYEIEKLDDLTVDDLIELEYNSFHSFFIQNAIYRRTILNAIGGFDEDMTGDDIVIRIKTFFYLKDNQQYSFELINESGVCYRMHNNNVHKDWTRQIKTVTEVLDRFFPTRSNPDILIDWVCSAIRSSCLEEYLKIFTLNKRCTNLLLERKVQKEIVASIVGYRNIYLPILNKKRSAGRKCITLFGFIKYYKNI